MQCHQGLQLRNLIVKSNIKIKELIQESGVNRGSLYNFFGYEEIPRKKIEPLLMVLKVSYEEFLGLEQPEEVKQLRKELEECRRENMMLCKDVIRLQQELMFKEQPVGV